MISLCQISSQPINLTPCDPLLWHNFLFSEEDHGSLQDLIILVGWQRHAQWRSTATSSVQCKEEDHGSLKDLIILVRWQRHVQWGFTATSSARRYLCTQKNNNKKHLCTPFLLSAVSPTLLFSFLLLWHVPLFFCFVFLFSQLTSCWKIWQYH